MAQPEGIPRDASAVNSVPTGSGVETHSPRVVPVSRPARRGFQRIYRWRDPVGWLLPAASAILSFVVAAVFFRSSGIALALIAMLFVHEMGHVIALKLKRIPVSAPIFIPLVGAFVVTGQIRRARDAAAVALAGPFAGGLGALACLGVSAYIGNSTCLAPVFTGAHMRAPCFSYIFGPGYLWLVLAHLGFLFNLINLLPLFPLDGGRVAGTLSRWLWPLGILLSGTLLWLDPEPFTWILMLGAALLTLWAFTEREPFVSVQATARTKVGIAIAYAGLVLLLGAGTLLTHDYIQVAHFSLLIPHR